MLDHVDLSRASLRGAILFQADLTGANQHQADLSRADLRWAVLELADLRGADQSYADLNHSKLEHADLTGALWIDAIHRCSNQNCDGKAY